MAGIFLMPGLTPRKGEAVMNFNGRWIPMEVMNTIVVLWILLAVVAGVIVFLLRRAASAEKPGHEKPHKQSRKMRGANRRR